MSTGAENRATRMHAVAGNILNKTGSNFCVEAGGLPRPTNAHLRDEPVDHAEEAAVLEEARFREGGEARGAHGRPVRPHLHDKRPRLPLRKLDIKLDVLELGSHALLSESGGYGSRASPRFLCESGSYGLVAPQEERGRYHQAREGGRRTSRFPDERPPRLLAFSIRRSVWGGARSRMLQMRVQCQCTRVVYRVPSPQQTTTLLYAVYM